MAVLGTLLAAGGCRSKEGSTGGGSTRSSDPLVVGPGRIPKQNVPMPDRGTAGGKTRDDPLLGSPTSRPSGSGYTDDPERWKGGPYKPGPGGTPAALAGVAPSDGDELKIPSSGVPLTQAGGPTGGQVDAAAVSDPVFGQLARYGVERGDYSIARETGQVVVRVKVRMPDEKYHGYEGRGASEAEAVKQVVGQIQSDRK